MFLPHAPYVRGPLLPTGKNRVSPPSAHGQSPLAAPSCVVSHILPQSPTSAPHQLHPPFIQRTLCFHQSAASKLCRPPNPPLASAPSILPPSERTTPHLCLCRIKAVLPRWLGRGGLLLAGDDLQAGRQAGRGAVNGESAEGDCCSRETTCSRQAGRQAWGESKQAAIC